MAQALAVALNAPLVSTTVSRLLIDVNRPIGHPQTYSVVTRDIPMAERETIAAEWARPADALSRHKRGEFEMRTPTVHTLELFADYDSVARLRQGLGERREISVMLPRIGRDGRRILPGEPGYDEAAPAA